MSQPTIHLSALVAIYLANGGQVTRLPRGYAQSRLRWGVTTHPTRNLPLSLGIVGRW